MSGDTPISPEDLSYRRGVGAVLFNTAGLVFAGRRRGVYSEAWQMPQGGIDEGESPDQAVLRELEEETGTDKAKIITESRDWLTYDLPDDRIGVAWGGKYRGQTLKWFALEFTGLDRDIDINAHEKPEFSEWRWVALDELPGLIVPFKRRLYDDILAEFHDLPEKIASRT
ncbi:MAG: RNA pyrophosphohydrolase [Rhodospirillales bacterium]|nr:RNA pyrophosphohydrolase [Rhodospirillales bacterium]